MTPKFTVLTTRQFDRESGKLSRAHHDFDEHLKRLTHSQATLTTLGESTQSRNSRMCQPMKADTGSAQDAFAFATMWIRRRSCIAQSVQSPTRKYVLIHARSNAAALAHATVIR